MTDEITICFYNRFSYDIAQIRTIEQKNSILSQMQEIFQEVVRNKPSCRNELSKVYQELKIQCDIAS